MPPKRGGGVAGGKQRNQILDKQNNQNYTTADKNEHLNDVKIHDIQLSRSGLFTLYASDVSSFSRLLNEFTIILAANGQQAAKIFVPRSIQRIKDTEMVAFVKRIDLEIPENRITESLTKVGLDVINVIRLTRKDGNAPTSTIKITFKDANNRNTFIHTGLQVDSMHFNAEAASQNKKPVQCYICLQYNHVAKYCKTKQQICAKCGDNHRIEQCTAANDTIKCNNCKGKHLATANDCPNFLEQEKRIVPTPNSTHDDFQRIFRNDVVRIVETSNIHRHSANCYKYSKANPGGLKTCRMRVPRALVENSHIDVSTGQITMRRSHPWINNFNEWLISACRCNMDIKFIWTGSDAKALVYYPMSSFFNENRRSPMVLRKTDGNRRFDLKPMVNRG
ncbi:unnamed protein product [Rotaria socialis]